MTRPDMWPDVPDNAFNRFVAGFGATVMVIAILAFVLLCLIFAGGALYGIGSAIFGYDL